MKSRYTVFVYQDSEGNDLVSIANFLSKERAIENAEKYVNKFPRVEVIDNETEEKIY